MELTSDLIEYFSVKVSEKSLMSFFKFGKSALVHSHIFLLTGLWYLALTSEPTKTISWSLTPGTGMQDCTREGLFVAKISRRLCPTIWITVGQELVSYNLDYSRARAYYTCSRCGWGLFGHLYSHLSFFSPLSPSVRETAR